VCGIAGIVSFDADGPPLAAAQPLSRDLLDTLGHRGPDGEGSWTSRLHQPATPADPAAILVHRRLSVIDPRPRSSQPFTSPDDRLVLVFNGELFNFHDLRRQLDRDWHTTGDTEVLLAAYETWGEACVEHLDGMFAFAILDRRGAEAKLFLARDPAGEKPLYVAHVGNTVAFASELRPLRRLMSRLGMPGLDVHAESLRDYLAWGYVPGDLTIHRGVEKLPPGHTMTASARGVRRQRYFDGGGSFELESPRRWQSTVGTTRELVGHAVQKRLVSDVPIGCLLSGGIDSSIVAQQMTRHVDDVDTFSVGFDGSGAGGYDESRFAAEVARFLETTHHEFRISPASLDAEGDLQRLTRSFGEPFADSSMLPTRLLAERVRGHVTVALGGDGGDELFGGYDRYRALLLIERLRQSALGTRAATWMADVADPLASRLGEKNPLQRLARLAAVADLPAAEQYASHLRLFSRDQIRWISPGGEAAMLSTTVTAADDPGRVGGLWFEPFLRSRDDRPQLAAAAAAIDRVTYLPGDLLTKVDRCSMLHGLEVRCPFVDADLLRFASTLGDDDLTGPRRGKRLLRAAFGQTLPNSVFARKKRGFAIPISSWLRGKLRPMLHDHLFASDAFAKKHFDPIALRLLCRAHDRGRGNHGHRLFALLMLELWWRDARGDL
jgi:asparagine synthase (glutamine-hydrolysing)